MQPSKQSLYSPTFAIAPQRTTVWRRLPTLSSMRGNHLDSVSVGQVTIQAVAIVGFVANQSRGKQVEETMPENSFHQLAFVWRSAFQTNGERKTVIIGESDDFRPLAALGGPDGEPPFFAP
jgi:hypothetical protein